MSGGVGDRRGVGVGVLVGLVVLVWATTVTGAAAAVGSSLPSAEAAVPMPARVRPARRAARTRVLVIVGSFRVVRPSGTTVA